METTVYIQAINGFPFDDWACNAFLGFRNRQANIVLYEDIKEVPLNRHTILIGCIEDTKYWWQQMGWPIPAPIGMPTELIPYADRWLHIVPLYKAFTDYEYPYFIKPYEIVKQFMPGVVCKREDKKWFYDVPMDTQVLVSQVEDFVSEYRGYVIDGKLEGFYHYKGDFAQYPDIKFVERMVDAYTTAPAGYSIDVGVTATGKTKLIECNDGWSLGNYGLPPNKYTRLLVSRWMQILKSQPVLPTS